MKKQIRRILLGDEKEIERNSIFWNMLFSILSALQLSVMMMAVNRVNGTDDAGILSIAYAMAYLMYAVGAYGVRNFQATDSKRYYSYHEYRMARLISCVLMIIFSFTYCLWKNYESYKAMIIMLICLLKLEEAVEDLYHGEFQRAGRLDIAGRLGTIRLGISYIVFIVFLVLMQNLFVAIVLMIIVSFIIIAVTRILLSEFIVKEHSAAGRKNNLLKLLAACFPLFVTGFLRIYISNAPKYAIDLYLSEKDQAYYAIISMPVFAIGLLSGMIYRPQLFQMAQIWNADDKERFKSMIWKQIRNVIIILIITIGVGLSVGLKILEFLYGVSLLSLRKEFAVLLIGGGMLAVYYFLSDCLTIMRKQVFMLVTSGIVMLFAGIVSNPLVQSMGLTGASYLYLILMIGEAITVSGVLYINLRKNMI